MQLYCKQLSNLGARGKVFSSTISSRPPQNYAFARIIKRVYTRAYKIKMKFLLAFSFICTLVHIFMRISWRTRICKNIPRPWRPWPTGEMVYCECGTTNKKQGEYLEAGGRGLWGGERPQDIHRASRWASHILAYV